MLDREQIFVLHGEPVRLFGLSYETSVQESLSTSVYSEDKEAAETEKTWKRRAAANSLQEVCVCAATLPVQCQFVELKN